MMAISVLLSELFFALVSFCMIWFFWHRLSQFSTSYRTTGVGKRARSASLYHSRQCGILRRLKPRL